MRRRRHDTGILVDLLPMRTLNTVGPAPTEMRVASAASVSQFRRWRVLFAQPSREVACPIRDNHTGPRSL